METLATILLLMSTVETVLVVFIAVLLAAVIIGGMMIVGVGKHWPYTPALSHEQGAKPRNMIQTLDYQYNTARRIYKFLSSMTGELPNLEVDIRLPQPNAAHFITAWKTGHEDIRLLFIRVYMRGDDPNRQIMIDYGSEQESEAISAQKVEGLLPRLRAFLIKQCGAVS